MYIERYAQEERKEYLILFLSFISNYSDIEKTQFSGQKYCVGDMIVR